MCCRCGGCGCGSGGGCCCCCCCCEFTKDSTESANTCHLVVYLHLLHLATLFAQWRIAITSSRSLVLFLHLNQMSSKNLDKNTLPLVFTVHGENAKCVYIQMRIQVEGTVIKCIKCFLWAVELNSGCTPQKIAHRFRATDPWSSTNWQLPLPPKWTLNHKCSLHC